MTFWGWERVGTNGARTGENAIQAQGDLLPLRPGQVEGGSEELVSRLPCK